MMDRSTDTVEGFGSAPKKLARRLLMIGGNRLEPLVVEVQEERERILHALFLILGVALFALLAGAALSIAVVVLLWHLSPVAVLLLLTGIYTGIALFLYRRFTVLQSNWESFPATVDQLRKDRECLEETFQ